MPIPESIFKDGLLDLIKHYDTYIKDSNNDGKRIGITEYYIKEYSVIEIGKKYGRLTVLEKAEPIRSGLRDRARWKCRCNCGNEVIVMGQHLPIGHTLSCGCLHAERVSESLRRVASKHGLCGHPLYTKWRNMKIRCYYPAAHRYNAYGGRGITVCDRWKDFKNFYDDMIDSWKPGLTLERIDVNGNYCKENCTWISFKRQSYNRQDTVWVEINGEKLCLTDAVKKHGNVSYATARDRVYKYGWSPEDAISIPSRISNKRWIEINGEKMRVYDAIKKYGIMNYNTIMKRINAGWPLEKAILTKSKNKTEV